MWCMLVQRDVWSLKASRLYPLNTCIVWCSLPSFFPTPLFFLLAKKFLVQHDSPHSGLVAAKSSILNFNFVSIDINFEGCYERPPMKSVNLWISVYVQSLMSLIWWLLIAESSRAPRQRSKNNGFHQGTVRLSIFSFISVGEGGL